MTKQLPSSLLILLLAFGYIATAQINRAGVRPHLLVYKTTADYNDRVPVILSEDKTKIISYPAPADVRAGSTNLLPVALHKGYLLSKYGIGKNTVFLKLTYEEYAAFKTTPAPADLYRYIKNKNPVKELCDCGVAGQGDSTERKLNRFIDEGLLRTKCKIIK